MKLNKKGMAFEWFYTLIFIFAIGLAFIIFNNVLEDEVKPIAEDLVPDDFDGKAQIVEDNNKFFSIWMIMPLIFFFVIIIYLIVQGIGTSGVG